MLLEAPASLSNLLRGQARHFQWFFFSFSPATFLWFLDVRDSGQRKCGNWKCGRKSGEPVANRAGLPNHFHCFGCVFSLASLQMVFSELTDTLLEQVMTVLF